MYRFITPGHEMRVDPSGKDSLWSRIKYIQGDAVIKYRDGTYKQVQVVNPDELNMATVYLGGHVNTVDAAEAASLTTAGYGAYLTEIAA